MSVAVVLLTPVINTAVLQCVVDSCRVRDMSMAHGCDSGLANASDTTRLFVPS